MKHKNIINIFIVSLLLLALSSCAFRDDLELARKYASGSKESYALAVAYYQKALNASADNEPIMEELGELYFRNGDFENAIDLLKEARSKNARKTLAVSLFRSARFTDALAVFDKLELSADEGEHLYFYGLTCEELNLYNKAQEVYAKIQSGNFAAMAGARLENISKETQELTLDDLDKETRDMIVGAGGAEEYPEAGAVILLSDESVEIFEDNTAVFQQRYLVKILNERGRENFAEIEIGYDSTDESVEIEYARTIRDDGKVVMVGDKHIRDVSRYLNFPLYSNARVKIISMPEVSEGSVIEYKAKIFLRKLVNDDDFMTNYRLQEFEPVKQARFEVTLPAGRVLNTKLINERYNFTEAKLEPAVTEEYGKQRYAWLFNDIPQIIPEDSMPPVSEIDTAIMLSTFRAWDEIYNWWWKLAEDKIKPDSAIEKAVAELTQGKDSDYEKIKAVYNFCAQKVRYVAVEYGQAGYEPHSAAEVFSNKYGDCKDKAVLLITMLKAAGFKAHPVLIGTKGTAALNQDFPTLTFNHAIAVMEFEGSSLFMDTTCETCALGDLPDADQNRDVLVIKDEGYEILRTPFFGPDNNRLVRETSIQINADESIAVESKISSFGQFDQMQRFWFIYTQPQLIEEGLKQQIQSVSVGAQLIDYKIDNLDDLSTPVVLNYSFNGPEFLISAEDIKMLPPLAELDTSIAAKGRRVYPIDLVVPETIEKKVTIDLPSHLKLKYLPQGLRKDSEWFDFIVEYEFQEGRIVFYQKQTVKKTEIAQPEYPAFKSFLEELGRAVNKRVVLEKVQDDLSGQGTETLHTP